MYPHRLILYYIFLIFLLTHTHLFAKVDRIHLVINAGVRGEFFPISEKSEVNFKTDFDEDVWIKFIFEESAGKWEFKASMEVDATSPFVHIKNVSARHHWTDQFNWRIGRFKKSFGLEQGTAKENLIGIGRSRFQEAWNNNDFGRHDYGLEGEARYKDLEWLTSFVNTGRNEQILTHRFSYLRNAASKTSIGHQVGLAALIFPAPLFKGEGNTPFQVGMDYMFIQHWVSFEFELAFAFNRERSDVLILEGKGPDAYLGQTRWLLLFLRDFMFTPYTEYSLLIPDMRYSEAYSEWRLGLNFMPHEKIRFILQGGAQFDYKRFPANGGVREYTIEFSMRAYL